MENIIHFDNKIKYEAEKPNYCCDRSGSGIGRACAIEFVKEGAKVIVADINLQGAEETVSLIKDERGAAVAFKADVSEPESVKQLVDFSIKTWGEN